MKFLAWFFGVIATLVVGVYVVAFTGFGNGLLQPVIESKIQEQTKLKSSLKTFQLSMSDFEILLEINKNNSILLKGNYSIFTQAFNIAYRVNLEELSTLESLTQRKLNSSFHTEGSVVGDMAFIKVDGSSDVAKSKTAYHVELTQLNPTSIIAKVESADLKSLLYMLNEKEYATAKINLDVNFKNITPHQLDGNIKLATRNGALNSDVMYRDFNITIPKTAFSMNLDAALAGDDVDYSYILNSNLAKLNSSGRVTPEPLALDIAYGVDVKELAVLKPLTKADIRGPLRLNGYVKGTKEKLMVDGKSSIASSDTTFSALLKEFQPSRVQASIKNMRLQDLLYMVKQPHYADALLSLNADITDFRSGHLKGLVATKATEGVLDGAYLTKAYEFKSAMPRTTFSATTETLLNADMANTKLDFNSNLANFDIKEAKFKISDASIDSDYLVKVHDLNKLFFVTERELKGSITANGTLKKGKDLDFTAFSNIAGGSVDAKLHNDDFVANVASMKTLEILDMLLYPKIFQSSINGVVKYNLAAQKGDFKGNLVDGKFTKNSVLDLTKQYAHTDLYKETFVGDVNADINKENILATLNLKSNQSYIKTKDTKLNSKTQKIDSKLDISANGNPLIVTLKGDVNSPDVGVDASKLIQKEATKVIEKEAKNFLKRFF